MQVGTNKWTAKELCDAGIRYQNKNKTAEKGMGWGNEKGYNCLGLNRGYDLG